MSGPPPVSLHGYKIQGPAGPLEVLYRATGEGRCRGGALICHPHPLYGGTMHTRIVHHLARAMHEAGHATLRFNFRGVGLSAGRHQGGRAEQDDARAALEHLSERHPGEPLVVAGHSFGAWVGLRVGVGEPRVRRLIGVGLPLAFYDFGFLEGAKKDILLVQGDRDRFGAADTVRELARRAGGRAIILAGGEHLLDGYLDELREAVRADLPVA